MAIGLGLTVMGGSSPPGPEPVVMPYSPKTKKKSQCSHHGLARAAAAPGADPASRAATLLAPAPASHTAAHPAFRGRRKGRGHERGRGRGRGREQWSMGEGDGRGRDRTWERIRERGGGITAGL
jgi:hypothetical protein